MKKYLWGCLALLFGLFSCGDDEKPYVKPLNKLTKVTCTLAETEETLFTAEITYMENGNIAQIENSEGDKWLFTYDRDKININNLLEKGRIECMLSGNAITSINIFKLNPYANSTLYQSDQYAYHYSGSQLTRTDWTVRWPNPDGLTCEEKEYEKDEIYTWTNGNVTSFTKDKKWMEYEYGAYLRPANLPFRVIGSFSPVGFEVFSPLNFFLGSQNRNLPERAYWYTIPDSSSPQAEYTYQYNTTFDDYLMSMTIVERSRTAGNETTRTYKYAFEYNFQSL